MLHVCRDKLLSFFGCSCAALGLCLKLAGYVLLCTLQGNVGTEASISSGTYSQPSHYFESIPE
eukprot:scaffold832_cov17-Tisochrysis_lutea.AAC.1